MKNRVQPDGAILAVPARGLFMGNRGRIDLRAGSPERLPWQHRSWISCSLSFVHVAAPRQTYTKLFFLDEAVALAAGHRPCGRCRRMAYDRFGDCWFKASGNRALAPTIDGKMHADRVSERTKAQRRYVAAFDGLPDGTFVLDPRNAAPAVVFGGYLLPYTPDGYSKPLGKPSCRELTVLTPRCVVDVLKAGYVPELHSSVIGMAAS